MGFSSTPPPDFTIRNAPRLVAHSCSRNDGALRRIWREYWEEEERIVQEKRGSFASLVLFVGGR